MFHCSFTYGQIIEITPIPIRVCETESDIPLSATPKGGVWSSNDVGAIQGIDSFSPSNVANLNTKIWLFYTFMDTMTSIVSKDSIDVFVDASPDLTIPADDSFCFKTAGQPLTKIFSVSAIHSAHIDWFATNLYGSSARATVGDIDSGNISFRPQGTRDTFLIGVNASGIGSCNDVNNAFLVVFYQDPACMLSIRDSDSPLFKIYPNPSSGQFRILGLPDYQIAVADMLGKKVNFFQDGENFRIDKKGLFLVTFRNEKSGAVITKRIRIE